jgi:hypothetical protein
MKTKKILKRKLPLPIYPLPNPYNIHVSINYKEAITQNKTIIVCGEGYTDSTGELTIKLTDTPKLAFLNIAGVETLDVQYYLEQAVIIQQGVVLFVATAKSTPNSAKPAMMTWESESKEKFSKFRSKSFKYYDLVNGTKLPIRCHYDLSIKVKSWDQNFTSTGNVFFSWLCIAEGAAAYVEVLT